MVQQHVALVEHREQVARARARRARRPAGAADRAARRSPAARSARAARRRSSGPGIAIDVVRRRCRAARAAAPSSSVGRRRLDLEPDDVAAAPAAHLALDHLEVRAAALVVELELGVAGQPDHGRSRGSAGPGNSCGEVRADDVLEQHERDAVAARRPARAAVRPGGTCTIASRRAVSPGAGVEQQREVQAERRQQRKRPRHVDRQRRQHRQHGVAEERRRAPRAAASSRSPHAQRGGCRARPAPAAARSVTRR